jgi:hypothetical protein
MAFSTWVIPTNRLQKLSHNALSWFRGPIIMVFVAVIAWWWWCKTDDLGFKECIHHHHCHDSPIWAIVDLGFPYNRIFTEWVCRPHAQPPTWRTRPPHLWPPETGWPSYTPRHWVPILVAFYDTHELRWDCSYRPVTTRSQAMYFHYDTQWQAYVKILGQ